MVQALSAIFGIVLSTTALQSPQAAPLSEWVPAQGDRFIADTKNNVGYIVHEDGQYTQMLIATGRREKVHYIGRTYMATTPIAKWTVKAKKIQGDRVTFGKSGEFLRLYRDGTEYTAYGIHDYKYLDDVLAKDVEGRYFSMGCILVPQNVVDLLEAAYVLNGNKLDFATVYGLDEATQNALVAQKQE